MPINIELEEEENRKKSERRKKRLKRGRDEDWKGTKEKDDMLGYRGEEKIQRYKENTEERIYIGWKEEKGEESIERT